MRRILLAVAALLASFTAAALPAHVELVETFRGVSQYRLKSNGMTILLVPNRASPVFTFMVVYHVGSRNEAPGNTGSAHLLEHMIFNKSTENFGRAKGHKTFQEVLYEGGAEAALRLPTFLGNHDAGRFPMLVRHFAPKASNDELLKRDLLDVGGQRCGGQGKKAEECGEDEAHGGSRNSKAGSLPL